MPPPRVNLPKGRRRRLRLPPWSIPIWYALIAVAVAPVLPRLESSLLPGVTSGLSPAAAVAIYSSVGTGMIALTGIVLACRDDFLALAFDEIRYCGARSTQVVRRMKTLAADVIAALPPERHDSLRHHQQRLGASIAQSFSDAEERQEASVEDRQGLGAPRMSG